MTTRGAWLQRVLSPEGPASPTMRLVLVVLARHLPQDGSRSRGATSSHLAECTGLDVSTVKRWLREAEHDGWIVRKARRVKRGRFQGFDYVLPKHLPEPSPRNPRGAPHPGQGALRTPVTGVSSAPPTTKEEGAVYLQDPPTLPPPPQPAGTLAPGCPPHPDEKPKPLKKARNRDPLDELLSEASKPALQPALAPELEPDPRPTAAQVAHALVAWWVDAQVVRPSPTAVKRQAVAAKRLAQSHSPEQIAAALLGMDRLYQHRAQGGDPWDLWDVERRFSKAVAAAARGSALSRERRLGEIRRAIEEAR